MKHCKYNVEIHIAYHTIPYQPGELVRPAYITLFCRPTQKKKSMAKFYRSGAAPTRLLISPSPASANSFTSVFCSSPTVSDIFRYSTTSPRLKLLRQLFSASTTTPSQRILPRTVSMAEITHPTIKGKLQPQPSSSLVAWACSACLPCSSHLLSLLLLQLAHLHLKYT